MEPDLPDLGASAIPETNPQEGCGPVFANRFVSIDLVPSRFGPFSVVTSGTGLGVAVLLVRDGSALLVAQPRYAVGSMLWELPRGGSSGDELAAPRLTAVREIREETAVVLEPGRLVDLGMAHPDSGILSTTVFLFLAPVPAGGSAMADGDEVDQLAWVPVGQLVQACADGTITDALTCVAVMRARMRGLI